MYNIPRSHIFLMIKAPTLSGFQKNTVGIYKGTIGFYKGTKGFHKGTIGFCKGLRFRDRVSGFQGSAFNQGRLCCRVL